MFGDVGLVAIGNSTAIAQVMEFVFPHVIRKGQLFVAFF
jgi:transcriptional accessory protein Tex/SPT6